jgi:acyl-CoA reductase-like NAD-dependent aldehyde dehydrogenase
VKTCGKKMNNMQIINPATEEIITSLAEDNSSTLQTKLDTLKKAQPQWANITLSERVSVIARFSDLMEAEIEELSSVLTSEVGKPLQQSRNEINGARARIKWMLNDR